MVICKFFLQGNCRFGESCRFEHQLNNGHNQNYNGSVLRQQTTFNNNRNVDLNTLVQSVVNDMVGAEKGGQWLLSCYSPCKEKGNMPGIEDQSFEEVRFGYYGARALGTLDQFVQQFQIAQQNAASVIRALQNPSPEAISTISKIYNSTANAAPNTFLNSNSNVFGQQNSGMGMFGQQNQGQTNQSIFAKANQKIFGGAQLQQNSIFGNQSVLNNLQQSNAFGSAPPQQSAFGGTAPQQSAFGSTPPQQSAFDSTPPQQSAFGSTHPQQSGFALGNFSFPAFANEVPAQNTSIFNQQPTQPNMGLNFAGQPGANPPIFNVQQNITPQQNMFANDVPTQPINMFGNVNSNIVIDDSVYSKIDELSQEDILSFQSASFEFGKIPEKPPTKEMCI